MRFFLAFLVFASTLVAADYVDPNAFPRVPGTDVGVIGGIDAKNAVRTNILNVVTDYNAAGVDTKTTGNITTGTNSLVVADATSFAVNHYVTVGMQSIQELTVTAGASASSDVAITIGTKSPSGSTVVVVPVLSGDSTTVVATKIRAATFEGITTGGSGAVVTFTDNNQGARILATYNPYGTGVTASIASTQTGSKVVTGKYITNVSGTTLTLSGNATASATGALVTHDDSTAIQAAINAAVANDVVYLPAGTYRLESALGIGNTSDNITIRGAGMALTKIIAREYSTVIGAGSLPNASDYGNASILYASPQEPITGGLTKGSTVLTLADTSGFSDGDTVLIAMDNQTDTAAIQAGAIPVMATDGQTNSIWRRRQMTRIQSKTSTTITIFPEVHYTPDANLSARLNRLNRGLEGFGIEDLWIDCLESTADNGIDYNNNFNSWIKGVKVTNPIKRGFAWNLNINCEIRGCYIDGRDGSGTNGAGILLDTVAQNLFEDNIVLRIFPCIEMNASSMGNVFGYNFLYATVGGIFNVNHGPHNSFNLYEGNITPNMQSDGYFGGASNDTFYRNWITGWQFEDAAHTSIIGLNRMARHYAFIGNILGVSSWPYGANPYSLGNPFIGNSSFNGTTQPSAARSITSITRSSTTATVTTSTAHNLSTGDFVWIRGANETDYNGYQEVTVTGGSTFTYTVANSPATPATGTLVMGREWRIWGLTGNLTTRTDDNNGVVTLNTLSDQDGEINGEHYLTLTWGTPSLSTVAQFYPSSATATTFTFTWGGTLPAEGTTFNIYGGANSWQQQDRDVFLTTDSNYPGTTLAKGNYLAWSDGGLAIPATEALGSDTLSDSYYLSAKPSWFGSLTWPPFDPTNPGVPDSSYMTRIPAGYRYINGNENYLDSGASATVSGTTTVTGTLTLP